MLWETHCCHTVHRTLDSELSDLMSVLLSFCLAKNLDSVVFAHFFLWDRDVCLVNTVYSVSLDLGGVRMWLLFDFTGSQLGREVEVQT